MLPGMRYDTAAADGAFCMNVNVENVAKSTGGACVFQFAATL